jgi:tetratricopeptide (TPR) repeat protein
LPDDQFHRWPYPAGDKAYNNIGELYRRKGLLDYAAMVFKMATEIDATHAHYFYNLGITYFEIGMLAQAEQAFLRAAELDPDDFDYVNELAQTRFNLKKFGEAGQVLEVFLSSHPDHDRGPEIRARLNMLQRKHGPGKMDTPTIHD